MTRTLEFRPSARTDFDEAADWYEIQRPGLRFEFVQAVDSVLANILRSPNAFPIVHGSKAHRALVHRFPYAIYFSADDQTIVVYAVFHTSRNPIIWHGRLA